MPGTVGGGDWVGAAAHPETGWLYVPSHTNPYIFQVSHSIDSTGQSSITLDMRDGGGPRGLPLTKPPYSRITAIDLNSGQHQWMVRTGKGPVNHPDLRHLDLPPLGTNTRFYVAATSTLLLVASESPHTMHWSPHDYFIDLEAFSGLMTSRMAVCLARCQCQRIPWAI